MVIWHQSMCLCSSCALGMQVCDIATRNSLIILSHTIECQVMWVLGTNVVPEMHTRNMSHVVYDVSQSSQKAE